jgi:hypothetical protein
MRADNDDAPQIAITLLGDRSKLVGLESAFTTFGGVPEEVLMDNPRALVVRHDAVSRSVCSTTSSSRLRSIGASVLAPARRIGHARRARRRVALLT